MLTYKFKTNTDSLDEINKNFARAYRTAHVYWEKKPDSTPNEVITHLMGVPYIVGLDRSLITMAVNQVKHLKGRKKVIFGSKRLFYKIKEGKATKEDKEKWKKSRNTGMFLRGAKGYRPSGNRKATLDFENNQVIIWAKASDKKTLTIDIPENLKVELLRFQKLCENGAGYFNVQVNDGYICMSFNKDILHLPNNRRIIKNRILGVDLNPNYLAITVKDEHRVIHKEIYDFKKLNLKSVKTTKKKHEKILIAKEIAKKAAHFQCEAIALEELNIDSGNSKKGKNFNYLSNNTWHRNITVNSIKKHAKILNVHVLDINPKYSSFMGCMKYPKDFDSIAASTEMADRGIIDCKVSKAKTHRYLPKDFSISEIPSKVYTALVNSSYDISKIDSWYKLYQWLKTRKYNYRNLFDKSRRSMVKLTSKKFHGKSKVFSHLVS